MDGEVSATQVRIITGETGTAGGGGVNGIKDFWERTSSPPTVAISAPEP